MESVALVKDAALEDAQETRRAHWGTQLPIDPFSIARSLGIEITYMTLDPGISGMLIRKKGRAPQIIVDENDTPARQNFTVAHEIGHYIERVKVDPEGSFSFTDYRGAPAGRDLHEFYADEFAGNLLAPPQAVKMLSARGMSAIEMAKAFDISLPAMQTRLRRLGKS
nr:MULTISPECIES: ImmA/IrrE family metallo-endopeptidase [unclassified Rhodococcus (in: high G+C Gram-positive bacteria)]